ncbi:MAG: AAA family ATPase [Thioploca sp.]|nr:AAA family ATPase [Thioploca sp.]
MSTGSFSIKTIKIDRKKGFLAEGRDKKLLPLESLSSGEQHELVLNCDLLFKILPNTLVLIDEPELSLHLSWQKRFLQDLLEIVKIAEFNVLIATHSPLLSVIILNSW